MLKRRGFLLLLGVAGATTASGLWMPDTGLVELPRRFVLEVAGACWFCQKPAERVARLVGVPGRPTRVCNECIELCFDIIEENGTGPRRPPPLAPPPAPAREDSAAWLRLREQLAKARQDELLAGLREEIRPQPPRHSGQLACSFCDALQKEVKKLIAGPTVFICDICVGDAGALMSAQLVA